MAEFMFQNVVYRATVYRTGFQFFGIAATVCKKQWIWQILQKKKENENNESEFSDQKIDTFGL